MDLKTVLVFTSTAIFLGLTSLIPSTSADVKQLEFKPPVEVSLEPIAMCPAAGREDGLGAN